MASLGFSKVAKVSRHSQYCLINMMKYSRCRYVQHDNTDKPIEITWRDKNGNVKVTRTEVGKTLLNVARANEIDLEGACEGVCACSTCHVILDQTSFDGLPEASEEEEDMLDQAFGLTATSRLGCQCVMTLESNGMQIQLPKATRNFYVVCHINICSFRRIILILLTTLCRMGMFLSPTDVREDINSFFCTN